MRRSLSAAACSLVSVLVLAAPALAQEGSGCSGFKWPVGREQAAFAAEGIATISAGAPVPVGMAAVVLKLGPQSELAAPVPPKHKPKGSPAYAGAFPIAPVAVGGPYQVTLSDEAWIDVVQDGKLLKPTAFSGAKGCPDVRKSVRFTIEPGPATILISDASKDMLKLDVLPPTP